MFLLPPVKFCVNAVSKSSIVVVCDVLLIVNIAITHCNAWIIVCRHVLIVFKAAQLSLEGDLEVVEPRGSSPDFIVHSEDIVFVNCDV